MLGGFAASSMPLMSLMFIKWGTAVLPMLLLAHFVEQPDWMRVLKHWKMIAVLAALGIAGYSFMFYRALSTTTAVNASLINAFNPALIVVAAMIFLGEKLTAMKIGGIIVAFAGVLWVLTGGNLGILLNQGFAIGDVWMLAAISCWTAYTITAKKSVELPALTSCALQMTFFTIAMVPLTILNGLTLPTTAAARWSLAYIAIFPSAVAFWFWNYGTKIVEPGIAGQALNLAVPFIAAMTLLSGGIVTSVDLVGGVLILAGVSITMRSPREPFFDRVSSP
ncbi:EamA-like transporter family protein [Gluconacetobacter liquefaciens]|nr:EamA-like transporter family protein [Gluconacetobacter liquefaciens]